MKKNKSILADDELDRCYLCGRWQTDYDRIEEHHIFGGSVRQTSDRLGLVVHLCRNCHNHIHGKGGGNTMHFLHTKGQMVYEEQIGSREQFRKDFIRSYL